MTTMETIIRVKSIGLRKPYAIKEDLSDEDVHVFNPLLSTPNLLEIIHSFR